MTNIYPAVGGESLDPMSSTTLQGGVSTNVGSPPAIFPLNPVSVPVIPDAQSSGVGGDTLIVVSNGTDRRQVPASKVQAYIENGYHIGSEAGQGLYDQYTKNSGSTITLTGGVEQNNLNGNLVQPYSQYANDLAAVNGTVYNEMDITPDYSAEVSENNFGDTSGTSTEDSTTPTYGGGIISGGIGTSTPAIFPSGTGTSAYGTDPYAGGVSGGTSGNGSFSGSSPTSQQQQQTKPSTSSGGQQPYNNYYSLPPASNWPSYPASNMTGLIPGTYQGNTLSGTGTYQGQASQQQGPMSYTQPSYTQPNYYQYSNSNRRFGNFRF